MFTASTSAISAYGLCQSTCQLGSTSSAAAVSTGACEFPPLRVEGRLSGDLHCIVEEVLILRVLHSLQQQAAGTGHTGQADCESAYERLEPAGT